MKTRLRNIALFVVSPFIALVYLFVLPFYGLYHILNIAVEKALTMVRRTTRAFLSSPFVSS